ncbi:MAG: hypothetical protein ACTHK4_17835 [Mycobacteriales bacterium]
MATGSVLVVVIAVVVGVTRGSGTASQLASDCSAHQLTVSGPQIDMGAGQSGYVYTLGNHGRVPCRTAVTVLGKEVVDGVADAVDGGPPALFVVPSGRAFEVGLTVSHCGPNNAYPETLTGLSFRTTGGAHAVRFPRKFSTHCSYQLFGR